MIEETERVYLGEGRFDIYAVLLLGPQMKVTQHNMNRSLEEEQLM